MTNERVYKIAFSSVYPLYVQKAERKGRTKTEVDTVIQWLTGYDDGALRRRSTRTPIYKNKTPFLANPADRLDYKNF
jgi:hypothetical protein